ncbi:MAG: AraC family transcriptional regulator [Bacteroidota bacterium]
MKALFEQVEVGLSQSLKVRKYQLKNIDVPYHYHPELELVLIIKSTGKIFVRNSMVSFGPGDLFLFGSNVPHVLISDQKYYEQSLEVELLVIQLHQDLEQLCLQLPEFHSIKNLLELSGAGLKFAGVGHSELGQQLDRTSDAIGFGRLNEFLKVLNSLSENNTHEFIDRIIADGSAAMAPARLQKVKRYLLENYNQDISLADVANVASMNKASFCRYFKEHTRRTFSEYLNELRIDYASKLLIEGSFSITQICYEAGFNYLPYFIKQFKKIQEVTPSQYRREYMQ